MSGEENANPHGPKYSVCVHDVSWECCPVCQEQCRAKKRAGA